MIRYPYNLKCTLYYVYYSLKPTIKTIRLAIPRHPVPLSGRMRPGPRRSITMLHLKQSLLCLVFCCALSSASNVPGTPSPGPSMAPSLRSSSTTQATQALRLRGGFFNVGDMLKTASAMAGKAGGSDSLTAMASSVIGQDAGAGLSSFW